MRASRSLQVGLWIVFVVATAAAVSAHRLDEYLQAARVDLQLNRVTVDLDLTPGSAIAESIIAAIDQNGDEVVSSDEQEAYGRNVVDALHLALDGSALPLRLTSATFPSLAELRRGEGTIRLAVSANHPTLSSGRHEVVYRHGRLAQQSAFLSNALQPTTSEFSVAAQRRTFDQCELTIDYLVGPAHASVAPGGLLAGLAVVLLFVRYTRRHGISS